MLKTAAQHDLAVTTSLQRLPHPYNPQNTVTTSSNRIYYVILDFFSTKLESSRIQSKCCSIQYWFISSTVRLCYEISIDFSLIRSYRRVWESAGYRKSPFWT